MNLSMKWLKDYVDIAPDAKDFSEKMTMSGSKVEGWETEGAEIKNVVVGKVLSVVPHQNSDHLVVCQVEVGQDAPIQIVTGASNVVPGAMVPVALDGSTLPGGVKIKKGKLRGEVSNGMMCSLGELGLTQGDFPYAIEDGIFLLEEECVPGQNIKEVLGLDDTSVEFEITSNRPDCLSVLGLAREAAATYHVPLKWNPPVVKGSGDNIENYLKVKVDAPDLCPRYMARVVKNVKIGPSPRWMRERLRASGVRPINNLVDITNYVMLELGQPLHAFDLRYIEGNSITVRRAREAETIVTLDGVERTLNPNMLVISDTAKAVAVAGVMGGEYSGIMEDTQTVVFESACFDGPSVRLTAKALGMRTDASARYEKGLRSESCPESLERMCQLVEELGCGEVVDGVIDVDNADHTPDTVKLEVEWINKFLGIDLSREEMVNTLESLGFTLEGDTIIAPYYRIDIHHKADIAEEIARIYGYDKIPTSVMSGIARGEVTPYQQFERTLGQTMLSLGCNEIMTYSFISPKYYDNINLPADHPLRGSVVISNPLGEDTSIMRTTTLPSMMETLARNYNNRNPWFWCYEIGREYHPVEGQPLPEERKQLTIGLYGNGADFYTVKGMAQTLLDVLRIREVEFIPCTDHPTFHAGRCAVLEKDGVQIGILGEVCPKVLGNYRIGVRVYLAKLDCAALYAAQKEEMTYHPLPKYPASTRDLSLVCDNALPIAQVEKVIRAGAGKILEKLELFDVYRGDQVGKDQKSVSYSLVLRKADGTLTDQDCDNAVAKALKKLEEIGVSLRQ